MINNILQQKPNILIISPHPDDEIIGCGGLIALSKFYGATVNVLYMTVGASRQILTGSTNADERIKEIELVSQFGDFKYEILYINKNFILLDTVPQRELVDAIEDKIEKLRPDIVCIPFGGSYNQDHRATFDACITALRPIPQGIRHSPKMVLEYEEPYSWNNRNFFIPNTYLNLENMFNVKLKLMELHETQNRPDPFARSLNNLESLMKIRGSEIGLFYAEAYKLLRYLL